MRSGAFDVAVSTASVFSTAAPRSEACNHNQALMSQLPAAAAAVVATECAAGYAGKGNDGICKKCPAGTQVAAGGSVISSECLRCPQGTVVSRDGTKCTCAAGHYQVPVSRADPGFASVGCKMCTGRTQYITGSQHTSRSCSTCPSGQVANKAHTWCGE
jgi:hypothetical protein